MDYRPYILAGTFLLLVGALITFVVTLLRAARASKAHTNGASMPARNSRRASKVDTSLEGLEVAVYEDAPSAALLTPLKTGEWMPPEQAAPVEELAAASLAERVAEYVPTPAVPEPPSQVERHPAWKVAEVRPEPSEDEFGAEIAALLPQAAAEVPVVAEMPSAEVPVAAAAPAAPEPVPAEPAPAVAPPATISTGPTAAEAEDVGEWTDMLREQQGRPSVVPRVPVPPSARPHAHVTTSEPPAPAPPPASVTPAAPPKPRPRVLVHGTDANGEQVLVEATPRPSSSAAPGRREDRDVPDIVMQAPVEVWFGEARVGVKPGSAAYERFRKYADALLSDLKEARSASR